nr:unnamed protein product [Callosobruchus chinensis]
MENRRLELGCKSRCAASSKRLQGLKLLQLQVPPFCYATGLKTKRWGKSSAFDDPLRLLRAAGSALVGLVSGAQEPAPNGSRISELTIEGVRNYSEAKSARSKSKRTAARKSPLIRPCLRSDPAEPCVSSTSMAHANNSVG